MVSASMSKYENCTSYVSLLVPLIDPMFVSVIICGEWTFSDGEFSASQNSKTIVRQSLEGLVPKDADEALYGDWPLSLALDVEGAFSGHVSADSSPFKHAFS